MRKIVTEVVKVGHFFNRRKTSKIGVEGAPLHDTLLSSRAESNKLACFWDSSDGKFYLYSLIDGTLIASARHGIDCINDNYFEMYNDSEETNMLYCVNHDTNTYELVNDKYPNYTYLDNILVEYDTKFKKVCITNMDNKQKYEFTFVGLPDLKFKRIVFYKDVCTEGNFMIALVFSGDVEYFNYFNIVSKKFMFKNFFEGEVYDVREYEGELYTITHKNELLSGKGEILIESHYDNIYFNEYLPYVHIKKNNLHGLAHLEDCKIIFEAKYDEIIEEDKTFIAVSKVYTTYQKRIEEV